MNADFKAAVAVKFKELVAQGVAPDAAAAQAIQAVRAASRPAEAEHQLEPRPASASSSTAPAPPAAALSSLKRQAPEPRDELLEVRCPGGPFTCFICIEEKGPEERFLPHQCSTIPEQLCCRPCYAAWVESQIDADAAELNCCHCDLPLTGPVLQRLVDAEHWARYCETGLQRLLKRDPHFIWCSKCSGGGWVDPGQPSSSCGWVCPECTNSFRYCPYCRREHGSLTCKRFQQLRQEVIKGQRDAQDRQSEGMVGRSAKSCPSCKMPIQKAGGCNFMDCPNCRRHFCWSCGRILKQNHAAHKCDLGFESSRVVSKTPTGQACLELTRMFTNVLDIEAVDLLNTDRVDLEDLKEMLVPGLSQEPRTPLFVASECDGEVLLTLPFNFKRHILWEITHVLLRADHPPVPDSRPPRTAQVLPNMPMAAWVDFEDPSVPVLPVQNLGNGVFVVSLEQFRAKGNFRRVETLTVRLSASDPAEEGQGDCEVFFNDFAVFGLPSPETPSDTRRRGNAMYDQRANLIVSPVLQSRWGEESGREDEEFAAAQRQGAPTRGER